MDIVEIFKCFCDTNRLKIFNLLLHKSPLCVCEIMEVLSLTQSNVSRHLDKLRIAGVIDKHKKLQWSMYSINSRFEKESSLLINYIKGQLEYEKEFIINVEKLKEIDNVLICNGGK